MHPTCPTRPPAAAPAPGAGTAPLADAWARCQLLNLAAFDDDPLIATVVLGMRVAGRHVISRIEIEGTEVHIDGTRWYDVADMFARWAHEPSVLDMLIEDLAYVVARRLVDVHPTRDWLVRITGRAL